MSGATLFLRLERCTILYCVRLGIVDLKRLRSGASLIKKRSALNDIRANPQDHTKLDMTASSVLIYLFPFFTGTPVKVCSKRYQTS